MPSVDDYDIANNSGLLVRQDLNNVLEAIQTCNSESAVLTGTKCKKGMWFLQNNDLKICKSVVTSGGTTTATFADVGDISLPNCGLLSASGATMTGVFKIDDSNSAATPALSFDTDTDLGLFRKTANVMGFSANGVEQVLLDVNGITLQAQNDLRFADQDSSNYVGFKAPATVSSSLTWILPAADSTVNGYALVSDGSGTLSWAAAGGGAVGGQNDQIFWENDQTVTQSYTITNGKNAGSFGPITIQSGVAVTVGAGEVWSVV